MKPFQSHTQNHLLNLKLGATYLGGGRTAFCVWAPFHDKVAVETGGERIALSKDDFGCWHGEGEVASGAEYFYVLNDDLKRPDPASQYQPQGVHGPSQVVEHDFHWDDLDWKGIPLEKMVQYELHTGTFTPEGTFEGLINKLPYLKDLGINAIEIMPVSQFPGNRNWGYDGVYPFAVQDSYGGPEDLKKLVNECHKAGIAVILDVVYNHFGPEGNYLNDFGPYFTGKYSTPWGKALNFDDSYCDHVRNYFIQNALMWFDKFHIDALRLDAVHAIFDQSSYPFLRQLADAVEYLSEKKQFRFQLIAESDLNDVRMVEHDRHGLKMTGQWMDDFHHAVHALLTQEKEGYYKDFGEIAHLAKGLSNGFIYDGNYSDFRKKVFGSDSSKIPATKFVSFIQNHDQIGNRMLGDRLSSLLTFEQQKLAAVVLFTAPYTPMLFMGEEWGERNPFLYFISHGDKDLVEAVRKGRKEEFEGFKWDEEPPDPQSEETFNKSKLSWNYKNDPQQQALLNLYKQLISLKKHDPVLSVNNKTALSVTFDEAKKYLVLNRWNGHHFVLVIQNFGRETLHLQPEIEGSWTKILDTADEFFKGPGSLAPDILNAEETIVLQPQSAVVWEKE